MGVFQDFQDFVSTYTPPPVQPEPQGFLAANLGKGTALGKQVIGGIARYAGAEETGNEWIAEAKARQAELERSNPSMKFSDVTGVGSGARYIGENVLKMAPLMAGTVAGGIAGTIAAPAVGVGGMGAAALGALGAFVPSMAVETGLIASESDKVDGNRGRIAIAAAPAAALDAIPAMANLKMAGVTGLATKAARGLMGKTAVEGGEQAVKRGLAARSAIVAGKLGAGAAGEAMTESAQSPLEAWGADKPVFQDGKRYSDDLIKNTIGAFTGGMVGGENFTPEMQQEMKESFFAGGAAGLGMGAAGKVVAVAGDKLMAPTAKPDQIVPDAVAPVVEDPALATDPLAPGGVIPQGQGSGGTSVLEDSNPELVVVPRQKPAGPLTAALDSAAVAVPPVSVAAVDAAPAPAPVAVPALSAAVMPDGAAVESLPVAPVQHPAIAALAGGDTTTLLTSLGYPKIRNADHFETGGVGVIGNSVYVSPQMPPQTAEVLAQNAFDAGLVATIEPYVRTVKALDGTLETVPSSKGNVVVKISPYQEATDGAGNILPEVSGVGTSQVDRLGMAVPQVQGEVAGVGSNNIQSGGSINGLSSVQQEVNGQAAQMPELRGEAVATANIVQPADVVAVQGQIEAMRDQARQLQGKRTVFQNGQQSVVSATEQNLKDAEALMAQAGDLENHWYAALHPEELTAADFAEAEQRGMPILEGNVAPMVVKTVRQKTAQENPRRQLDTGKDSLVVAIAKMGGISPEAIRKFNNYTPGKNASTKGAGAAVDLAARLKQVVSQEAGAGILHVQSPTGMSLHDMRVKLVENGYMTEDQNNNDLEVMLNAAAQDPPRHIYSTHNNGAAAEVAYQTEESRYAEMLAAMTDSEYEEFTRNQWHEEQAAQFVQADDAVDEYYDAVDSGAMTAADWQMVENNFQEAFDATEFTTDSGAEVGGETEQYLQGDGSERAGSVLEIGGSVAPVENATATGAGGKVDRLAGARQKHMVRLKAELNAAKDAKVKAALQERIAKMKERTGVVDETPSHLTRQTNRIAISGKEFGIITDSKDLRRAATNYARENFRDKSYRNIYTGSDITVTWQGIKHAISNANDPELRILYALPSILENAKYDGIQNDKHERPDIKAIHLYSAEVALGNEQLNVGVVVRETKEGHKFYDHFIIKNKTPAGISEATSNKQKLGVQPAAGIDKLSIEPSTKNVKPEILDDFGEKLGGAKKDRQPSIDQELSDSDIAGKTLSEIWPKKEVDAIEDTFIAAVATAARAEIPNKPQKGYKLDRWVKQVQTVRMLAKLVQSVTRERFFEQAATLRLEGFTAKVRLLEVLDRALWGRIGAVKEYKDAYRYDDDGKKVHEPWSNVQIDGKIGQFRTDNVLDVLDQINAKLGVAPAEKKMQFEVRGRDGSFNINKKGDALRRSLKHFTDSREALNFVRDNHADLLQAWEDLKDTDNVKERDVRREDNRPRTGADHRKGKDATPEMILKDLGFRGIEFGNWVGQGKNEKERQGMLNQFYDAIFDLANILGVPPKALSLNGTLGIGFGSRGSGGYAAHYEPTNLVINLTKTRGAGSLAHELFHATDRYFQMQRDPQWQLAKEQNYITYYPETYYQDGRTGHRLPAIRFNELKEKKAIRNPDGWTRVEGVRPEVAEVFSELVKTLDASPMAKRSELIDAGKSGGYWGRIIERGARAFENYVIFKMQQQGYSNDYLANVTTAAEFGRDIGRYPYLLETELAPVVEAFDNLFSTIETKKTDKGVALFSKTTTPIKNAYTSPAELQADLAKVANVGARIKSGMLTILRNVGEMAKDGQTAFAKLSAAWHGSPHDHDGFDKKYRSTGEGNAARGAGHYFTDTRDIAEFYKDTLAQNRRSEDSKLNSLKDTLFNTLMEVDMLGFDTQAEAIKTIRQYPKTWTDMYEVTSEEALQINESMSAYEKRLKETSGKIYQVELAPADNEFLLWDAPLLEQSDVIKNAFDKPGFVNDALNVALEKATTRGRQFSYSVTDPTGGDLYRELVNLGGGDKQWASDQLLALGVRGVKYEADKISNNGYKGSFNYVIFDDADVSITAKYSLIKDNNQIKGMVTPDGKMFLFSDMIAKGEAANVYRHEIVHQALQDIIGSEQFTGLLKQVDNLVKNGNKTAVAAAKIVPENTPAGQRTEEILGYMMEINPNHSVVHRLVGMVKQWLFKHGIISEKHLNEWDMLALVNAVMKRMGKGVDKNTKSDTVMEGGTDYGTGKKNYYIPKRIPDSIGGNAEERNRADAERITRTSLGTVREAEGSAYPQPGATSLTGVQKEYYDKLKLVEEAALRKHMEQTGEFPSSGFVVAWKRGGEQGETEHKIAVSPGSKTVRKFGTAAINHTWTDYLQRLALHNLLFPGTAYTYQGLSTIDNDIHVVVDQPYIAGEHIVEADASAIDSAMRKLEFEPFVRPQYAGKAVEVALMARMWVRKIDRLAVWDIRPKNVLQHSQTKIPYFIDPVIEQLPDGFDLSSLVPLDVKENGDVIGSRFEFIDGAVFPRDLNQDEAINRLSRTSNAIAAAREQISQTSAAIPGVVSYAKNNWLSLINPLDFSRSARWVDDWTPDTIKAGFGYFFNNPFFEGLRDAAKKTFVEEGADRELNRMSLMMQFFGHNPGTVDDRTRMTMLKDFVTKWHTGVDTTAWEKLNMRYLKLSKEQQTAMDMITKQGDVNNTYYGSYRTAMLQPKNRAAGLTEETFNLYKEVYSHMQTVSRIREQHIEKMMLDAGISKAVVDKTIKDYRSETREVAGWMTRNHGEGNYITSVHHVVKELRFTMMDIAGGGQQAFLPFYPGATVMSEIEALAKKSDAVVTLTGKGSVIITSAEGQRLDAFAQEAEQIIPALINKIVGEPARLQKMRDDLEAKGALTAVLAKLDKRIAAAKVAAKDPRIMVMQYSRRHGVAANARDHAGLVEKDLKKYMPETFQAGEQYVTRHYMADVLSEEMYQNMPNDMAMQAGLEKSFEAALKHGEISSDELESLRSRLIQNTAEVLLGRAAGKYQIRRAPYLIEGYDTENVMSGYQDYMTGVAGMLSKADYAAKQFKHLTETDTATKPWAYKYVFDSLRNQGMADRISGNARAFVALWYMGLKPASALINATQIYTLGVADIGRIVGKGESAVVRIAKAQKDSLAGKLTKDEKEIFDSAIMQQQEAATVLSQITGHNEGTTGKASRMLHNVTGKAMALFQNIEVLNRKTIILASYRILRDGSLAAGVIDQAALKQALEINNSVNFDPGKHNLPGWARNPLGQTLYAMQSFTWNNLNWIYTRATSGERRDMIALLRYSGMLMAIGGASALAGGDELDKIYRKLRGKSLLMEAKQWTHKHGKEYGTLGEMADAFAWHGMAGLAGLNISNSMRLQIPVASQMLADATMPEAIGGVWAGLAKKAWVSTEALTKGDTYRAAESASPEVVSGAMRAYRQYDRGMTTLKGRPVFDEKGKPLKYSAGDAALRVLGFQPAEQSRRMEITMGGKALVSWWKDERDDLLAELRIVKQGERAEVMRKIMRFNRDVRASQAWGKVDIISATTVQNALTFKPNKKDMKFAQKNLE